MTIPLLDPTRARTLASRACLPLDVALLSATRTGARSLFMSIITEHPPEVAYRANGAERAEWATGSTLTVASPSSTWWRGRRFDALMLDVAELDLAYLEEIAPAFATTAR